MSASAKACVADDAHRGCRAPAGFAPSPASAPLRRAARSRTTRRRGRSSARCAPGCLAMLQPAAQHGLLHRIRHAGQHQDEAGGRGRLRQADEGQHGGGIEAADAIEVDDQKADARLAGVGQALLDALAQPLGGAEEQIALQAEQQDRLAVGCAAPPAVRRRRRRRSGSRGRSACSGRCRRGRIRPRRARRRRSARPGCPRRSRRRR